MKVLKVKNYEIMIKEKKEREAMRRAGRVAAKVLKYAGSLVRPGITPLEINDLVEEYTQKLGARSAPLNYNGFPKSICTSVNDVVCHGIPNDRPLQEGDILNIDITVIYEGFHGDTGATFAVGKISEEKQRLMNVALLALHKGIEQVKPGNYLGDIGYAIQKFVERRGYSVVRDYIGHGIGRKFHEDPQVPHVGKKKKGIQLVPGMTFTIEPMINMGSAEVYVEDDGWTVRTADGLPSAQYEHTVLVTETGVEVLTRDENPLF